MSGRILTLFGEEPIPEEVKGAGKSRAKKKPAKDEKSEGEEQKAAAITVEATTAEIAAVYETPMAAEPAQVIEAQPIDKIEEHINDATAAVTAMISDVVAAVPQQANDIETTTAVKKKKAKRADDAEEGNAGAAITSENIPENWQGSKQYYSIGEVAELFKVKTSHIRFWTNEFKLKVRTTRKGDRLYTPDQIRELRAIHHLVKERGFTLNGAKAKLKTQNKRDVETVDLKQSLLQLRGKLTVIRSQL